MNQKKKVIALAAITVMLLAPLAAQSSNTNSATAGVFETDVDNYMSVHDYSKVEMEKAFGYIGYDSNNLSLGYATKLGGLYLGSYYNGNALSTNDSIKETKNITTANQVTNDVITGETVTTTEGKTDPEMVSTNQIDVLVGVAGMGFKLGFYENLQTAKSRFSVDGSFNDASDSVATDSSTMSTTVTKYTEGSQTVGSIMPSLVWGMNLPVGGMTIKPYAMANVNFYQNKAFSVENKYTEVFDVKQSNALATNTKKTAGKDNGYIDLDATVGAGLDLAKNGTKQTSFGLSYQFDTKLYSNSDNDVKGNADWTETVTNAFDAAGTTTTVVKTVNTSEKSYVKHVITPAVSSTTELSDRVSFGMNFAVDVTFDSDKSIAETVTRTVATVASNLQDPADDSVTTTVVTTPGNTVETTTLTVDPTLKAGLTFKAIPGTLSFNTGLTVEVPQFNNATVTTTKSGFTSTTATKVDGLGVRTSDTTGTVTAARNESQTIKNDWDKLSAGINAGLTLNVDKNIAFDALMSNTGAFSVNATSLSLILSIKK